MAFCDAPSGYLLVALSPRLIFPLVSSSADELTKLVVCFAPSLGPVSHAPSFVHWFTDVGVFDCSIVVTSSYSNRPHYLLGQQPSYFSHVRMFAWFADVVSPLHHRCYIQLLMIAHFLLGYCHPLLGALLRTASAILRAPPPT